MINMSVSRVAYGERILFRDSSLLIRPKDRIGLVGPNGSGKTTIFRLITGEEHPDDGTIAVDPGTVIGYFSQDVGKAQGGPPFRKCFRERAGSMGWVCRWKRWSIRWVMRSPWSR